MHSKDTQRTDNGMEQFTIFLTDNCSHCEIADYVKRASVLLLITAAVGAYQNRGQIFVFIYSPVGVRK